jgi:dipeptidyl aminopeptidase/acylaminoacyl peptidase
MPIDRDLRATSLYRAVKDFYSALHAAGQGMVTDASDPTVTADGTRLAFSGVVFGELDRAPSTRICDFRIGSGEVVIQGAPEGANERLPRWSPDGRTLAFLSDRGRVGDPQLFLRDAEGGIRPGPVVDGVIESIAWSADGAHLLLGIAGHGADLAGCQGGAKTAQAAEALPTWMPTIDTGDAGNLWRSAAVVDHRAGSVSVFKPEGLNLWEVAWLDGERILAVVSGSHSEGSWYGARLVAIHWRTLAVEEIYTPENPIALPVASPGGVAVALIEAVSSDRMIVCGPVRLIDLQSRSVRTVNTNGVNVTQVLWRSADDLTYVGHRSLETVIGDVSVTNSASRDRWSSLERTCGAWYPTLSLDGNGNAFLVGEGYAAPPEIATVGDDGVYKVLHSLASPRAAQSFFNSGRVEPVSWKGRDGIELQGWLIRPPGTGPWPLVMDIHGGPVWMCRNRWQGRLRGAKLLAERGVASFYPNPRGSGGRGDEFATRVRGDMGGEDTHDYLTGIDALVGAGIADPARLGVTGISYGGYMSAWLVTQDTRFAAAVPISVVSNWSSQHGTSQIPDFDALFLDGQPRAAAGLYYSRSPVMFADRVRTPTLQITGALDQNTPPTQALEFHRALLEHGVRSVLATYPTAGHGVRSFPEVLDATTRYVGWFLEYFGIPVVS